MTAAAQVDAWKIVAIDEHYARCIYCSENLNYRCHFGYHIDLYKAPIYQYRCLKIRVGWKSHWGLLINYSWAWKCINAYSGCFAGAIAVLYESVHLRCVHE